MKKGFTKLLSLTLAFAMILLLTSCENADNTYEEDKNTETGTSTSQQTDEKTYVIRTVGDLLALSEYMATRSLDKDIRILLENDIQVNDTADFSTWSSSAEKRNTLVNFKPIKYFSGTFDGQGHTISGLYCCVDGSTEQNADAALIYCMHEGASVKNLNVVDSLFYSEEEHKAAVLAVYNGGIIQNCHTRAEVHSNGLSSSLLVACTTEGGQIMDCTTFGLVTGVAPSYQSHRGGISASTAANSIVRNCVNYGELRGGRGSSVGGIVGIAEGTVTQCSNYGNIQNNGNDTGGIVASLHFGPTASVTYCVNYAAVSNTLVDGGATGGVIGFAGPGTTLRFCENRGAVSAGDDAGGICGVTREEAVLSDCLNLGTVRNVIDKTNMGVELGGIVGNAWGSLERCCNVGNVDGVDHAGGIAGNTMYDVEVKQCWNFGETVSKKSAGGIVGSDVLMYGSITECYNYGVQHAPLAFDMCDTRNGVAPIDCYSLQGDGYEQPISNAMFDFETVWNLPTGDAKHPTLRGLPVHEKVSPLK